MIPWRQHARHRTSAVLERVTTARTAIMRRRARPRHHKTPVLLPRIASSMRATAAWCQREIPVLRSRIARTARGAVSRGRHARHRKPPVLLPRILIAALAAIALAAGFIPGMLSAGAAPAAVVTHSRVVTRTVHAVVISDKALILRARARAAAQAAARTAAILAAHTYTVRPGDSMSSVAERHCGPARDWTGIYAASRDRRWTAANANDLTAGQHLYLSCAYLPSMLKYAPAPPPPPVVRTVARVVTTYHGYHRAYHRAYSSVSAGSYGSVSASSYGGFQACVISRESGGNSQVMNSSSHYGLYQFSYSTWRAYGGSSATFGHASVAEQNQVFANAMAQGGQSNWSPYDGC